MIEQAIPRGTITRKYTQVVLLLLCFTLLAGCKKLTPTTTAPQTPAAGGEQQAAGPGEGASGRNSVLQMPFDNAAKLVLLNIGRAYQMAMISDNKPPKNAAELDVGPRGLKTLRDMQDHVIEVAYGVNPKKLGDNPGDYLLAWEKEPTNDGYRMVLMADFVTVKYVSQKEFEGMKKAK